MTRPIADYHVHTALCGHATGQPEEYLRTAVKRGLKEVGFADHAPLLLRQQRRYTMYRRQLPLYRRIVKEAAKKFPQLKVRLGLEADYVPGLEKQTKAMLSEYPYDFIIGSVHFIDGWAFDDPAFKKNWGCHEVNQVYRRYYELLRSAAASGLFDIIGHADLVKKFGHRPFSDMTAEVKKTASVFERNGVAVEINTSGLRKPVREIYPSLKDLEIYRKASVPVTFGSDAHDPKDVGADFDKAVRLARKAGYRRYVLFEGRCHKSIPLNQ